jgi:RNA polymerase sigma factor (sigma-70 family)
MSEHDADLVNRFVRSKDVEAWNELYSIHAGRVHRYTARMLGSKRQLDEDAAQTAWMRAVEKVDTLRDPSAFELWLIGIARRVCLEELALNRIERGMLAFPEKDDAQALGEAAPDDRGLLVPAADEPLEKAEEKRRAQTFLDRLALQHRELLILQLDEGMTLEDIAYVTGTTLATVKGRLRQAMSAMRKVAA